MPVSVRYELISNSGLASIIYLTSSMNFNSPIGFILSFLRLKFNFYTLIDSSRIINSFLKQDNLSIAVFANLYCSKVDVETTPLWLTLIRFMV